MSTTYEHLKYPFSEIEPERENAWEEGGVFKRLMDGEGPKTYVLEMFPYPSGRLHMGHVRVYTIGDVLARYRRMNGMRVLHPMGFDAFGLPAENAAIQRGIPAAEWTHANMARTREAFRRLGCSFNWDLEVVTCDPDYYRWGQWLFLKFFEKGLAYRKTTQVNWCETCATVLANEQVIDGCCWRCDKTVSQKTREGWFLRITAYAEELLEDLDRLPGWPERIVHMQRNWIGKSIGCEIDFTVASGPLAGEKIPVFTTRADTLFGCTFLTLAPEHPAVKKMVEGTGREAEVLAFIDEVARQDQAQRGSETAEKKGLALGVELTNPINGEKVPAFIANYVLMGYGTGAIMCVPAHDERDYAFAREYGLPIREVILPPGREQPVDEMEAAFTEAGIMANSGEFDGLPSEEGKTKVAEALEKRDAGRRTTNYRLRDWGISRQRYWGMPIPIVYCDSCGAVPVREEDLPVELPSAIEKQVPGESPLAGVEEWVNVDCPQCGKAARRETDTADTFFDSSWYFMRYCDPANDRAIFDSEKLDSLTPVDSYVGGPEHAVLHLLYARFFQKAVRDLGLTCHGEPFTNLITQGMVCKETQSCVNEACEKKGYLYPEEVEDGKCGTCGREVVHGPSVKMSKSKQNVMEPETLFQKYGSDAARLYILFSAPIEKDIDWSDESVAGCSRLLDRIYRLVVQHQESVRNWMQERDLPGELNGCHKDIHRATHAMIRKVTGDIDERLQFNTAIAAQMEYLNDLQKYAVGEAPEPALIGEGLEALLFMLSPFAPHISEHLWGSCGGEGFLINQPWPSYDRAALEVDEIQIVVQVNGKVRANVTVPKEASKETIQAAALGDEKVGKYTEGKEIRKVIVVPGKLINIVV